MVNKANNHLKQLYTKKTATCDIWIPGSGLDRYKNVAGLNHLKQLYTKKTATWHLNSRFWLGQVQNVAGLNQLKDSQPPPL